MNKRRIGCFIDSLNSGGAQRQLCLLAKLLRQNGCEVVFYVYKRLDFYKYMLDEDDILVRYIVPEKKVQRITVLARHIRRDEIDVLIAFLTTPVFIAELASLLTRKCVLLVSERSNDSLIRRKGRLVHHWPLIRFALHSLAHAVVANSKAQADFIKSRAPWLRKQVITIHNCVDLQFFKPSAADLHHVGGVHLLTLGRYEWEKNPLNLLEALDLTIRMCPETCISIDWYGNNFIAGGAVSPKSELFFRLQKAIQDRNLQEVFRLNLPECNVVPLYQKCSALILPSFYEGCSNVICEAMACGKPVLASNVGDNALFIRNGQNGYLFDPHDPRDMADKIIAFSRLKPEQKWEMGQLSRRIAEEMFSPDTFIDQYINIINSLQNNLDCN